MSTFSNLLSICWFAGAPHLGAVTIPVDEVVSGKKVEGWFHLTGPTATRKHGKPMQAQVCQALFMPTGPPITCKVMWSKVLSDLWDQRSAIPSHLRFTASIDVALCMGSSFLSC